ncbi:hypothetical protein Ddye_020410 [Dipteronia dyeriana]|uniref:Uncharacterized protein n=1 Tax=Dipteronia dyeriana TaxID=168575 RepID=A0AAD9TZM7_9ROSI|nr:hypothetical protein Ddye_020410 [Dipteronia dyeriana]
MNGKNDPNQIALTYYKQHKHLVAVLLAPHLAQEDCNVVGYHIRKGTKVLINSWSIDRDNFVLGGTGRVWSQEVSAGEDWYGIVCNSNNEVEIFELTYVDLLGNVPSNFTSLLSLKRLVLIGTNLTGLIPKEIVSLTQLKYLDLSENGLTD